MTHPAFDITPFLHQDEGQHFDRKSLFEGPDGAKRAREFVARVGSTEVSDEEFRALLHAHRPHGANSYYTLPSILSAAADRGEQGPDRGELTFDWGEQRPDRGEPARRRGYVRESSGGEWQ